eukprot:NODE_898_length_3216_cov_0.643247.p2 type:complete len:220 gc:universal NODE_898_length_3216_cov_0.643247:892-233(-)
MISSCQYTFLRVTKQMVNVNDQTFYKVLNQLLSAYSYVGGYQKSELDEEILKLITKEPGLPHLKRWYNHVKKAGAGGKATSKSASPKKPEDDDDIDLFGSDDEVDEEAEKLKAQRLAEYQAKKAKKPKVIAKSMITLDVKPWDDTTDLEEMVKMVRTIQMDGLTWAQQHKFVPVGFGIKKLQINVTVEDDKVSVDDLQEKIQEFEDHVQSVDVAAFMKL